MSYELDLISLFIEASFVVQMVMIILIVTSITSWWFIFDRWITLSRVEKDIFNFESFFWSKRNIDDLFLDISKKSKKIGLEQIFYVGYEEYNKSDSTFDVKKVMDIVASRH